VGAHARLGDRVERNLASPAIVSHSHQRDTHRDAPQPRRKRVAILISLEGRGKAEEYVLEHSLGVPAPAKRYAHAGRHGALA
jgi:hypothetical protein